VEHKCVVIVRAGASKQRGGARSVRVQGVELAACREVIIAAAAIEKIAVAAHADEVAAGAAGQRIGVAIREQRGIASAAGNGVVASRNPHPIMAGAAKDLVLIARQTLPGLPDPGIHDIAGADRKQRRASRPSDHGVEITRCVQVFGAGAGNERIVAAVGAEPIADASAIELVLIADEIELVAAGAGILRDIEVAGVPDIFVT
jgi:hypothetical protein